ncbi:uncharacterized protein [Physcomitrium patens]|uniref:Uncharacterized protein n=1 Tax=Physcomitrium patens TaxID=3218 RepID=A0A2K1IED8_PHYPA|nr:uncharacterized protein LOC112277544 [Physcomitrium patens]PNR27636.1 hypothetical protein PHYPA_029788 [Physcomitrium patens]|eukprot:XP_024365776.1 uncharacterized protein LOC112277544 [Physcomitrella patens]
MGNWISKKEPPPPVVLVPPLLERPHFATRSRMTESSYDLMFSKLARARLFNMYFDESRNILAHIVLQPADDPNVDVTARVLAPTDRDTMDSFDGEAVFRWQRDVMDPDNFGDLSISSVGSPMKVRACMFDTKKGLGAWTVLPLNPTKLGRVADNVVLGARYATHQFTMGTSVSPLQWSGTPTSQWVPTCAWACGKLGPITMGAQFKSLGQKSFENGSWSYAIDYGVGSKSPLEPSFNFCVELCDNSKLIASYYHHLVVQRRVKNPFEIKEVVAITNYVDLGFEFEHTLKADVTQSNEANASVAPKVQVAGSWQANKNVQVKAKLGSRSSGVTVILKSWWQPSVTLSLAAVRDHKIGLTDLGFGIRVENFGDVSYERADPNYVMLTPTKQHLAEGLLKETGKRPMLQSDPTDVKSVPTQSLPADLRPDTSSLM